MANKNAHGMRRGVQVIYCTFDTLYETNSKTGQMGSLTLKSRLLLFIFCIFKADEGLQYHM